MRFARWCRRLKPGEGKVAGCPELTRWSFLSRCLAAKFLHDPRLASPFFQDILERAS